MDALACVHEWFERQARRRGDAEAVTGQSGVLTYRELDRGANRLAHYLRALGVGPGAVVGVCLRRTPELVTALLAVLKAGGAYLPLDPASPLQRLSFMLADVGAGVLLTDDATRSLDVENVVLLGEGARLEEFNDEPPTGVGVTPDDLAYVIYTSGSTGTPKGVMVEHRNVTGLLAGTRELFGFGEQDVWSLSSSVAFDFSVWEMWGALLHGGRLVVVPEDVRRAPKELYALLHRERITVFNQTPSAFRQLIQAEELAPAELALRLVILGGEALTPEMLRPWFARHGDDPVLVNMYGITETTVHSTYRRMTAADLGAAASSPIGVAIPGWTLHVLDAEQNAVPAGEPGELYVGGAGVARGYLGRPEFTAERFLTDPFSEVPGGRFYRSGDRVRRLPGGDLEYLGRLDHQVKIRGYRIELGEVENTLTNHPAVAHAVAVAGSDPAGEPRLVAYWTGSGKPTVSELREYLARTLPDYMVPNVFVELDRLPLTPNGKTDRQALPAPEAARPELAAEFEAPDTALRKTIAAIWAEALWADEIGLDDDFFELGGHSMLATKVAAALMDQLGMPVSLRMIFDNPTVRELAAAVEKAREAA